MALTDIDNMDLSATMKRALRECVVDPEGRVEVSKRTAKALEKRGLVERSNAWIWVTAEQAALYTDGPVPEPEDADDGDSDEPVVAPVIEPPAPEPAAVAPAPEPEPAPAVAVEPEPEPEPEPEDPFPCPEPSPKVRYVRGQSTVCTRPLRVGLRTRKGRVRAWGPSEVLMDDGSVWAVSVLIVNA